MRRSEGSRTTHYQMRRVRLSGAVVFSMPLVAYRGGGRTPLFVAGDYKVPRLERSLI